jgi:hypothetical protein
MKSYQQLNARQKLSATADDALSLDSFRAVTALQMLRSLVSMIDSLQHKKVYFFRACCSERVDIAASAAAEREGHGGVGSGRLPCLNATVNHGSAAGEEKLNISPVCLGLRAVRGQTHQCHNCLINVLGQFRTKAFSGLLFIIIHVHCAGKHEGENTEKL